MSDHKKKKVAVAGFASILLVAAVVAIAIDTHKNSGEITTSTKSVKAVCYPTDYKETCEKSLSGSNTTDPRELIELAFKVTIESIVGVVKGSALLKEAAQDDSTKDAFAVCEDVLETAAHDLRRSAENLKKLDKAKVNETVHDLKTWLSAVITYQETCIDAFENTTGDLGEKMKALMKTTRELSSNGLAMVNDIAYLVYTLDLDSESSSSSRKLLSVRKDGRMPLQNDPTNYELGTEPERWLRRNLLSNVKPLVVVAQDGSGKFKTINDAIATVPKKNDVPFLIYVKAGVYREHVVIPKGAHKIVLIGDGPLKTIITGKLNFAAGSKTFHSATVSVNADDFIARDVSIENTAGPQGHQAVALRVSGDRAIFFNVHINGYQDTLYTHTYRQFYRDCVISGTIDFVFGDALAYFQNCRFVVRKPMDNQACMVTAQGRVDPRSQGAIVIQRGSIVAEHDFLKSAKPIKAYLGRPWKELSRTIIMQSNIDGFISPDGWSPWMGDFALNTLYYAEYHNHGAGSSQDNRVKWKGIRNIRPEDANKWTPGKVFGGDYWIRGTGIPYVPTMM